MRAEFVTSLDHYAPDALPDLPETAIAGRSNVGKSTLINKITNRHNLARVSSSPGKTRLLNVYRLDDAVHLVDLPGYGFAKASKEEQARWSRRVEGYFAASKRLARVLHLVDIRHEPTGEDVAMHGYMLRFGAPFVTIATKADKLSKAQRGRALFTIARTLQVQPWEIIAFSGEDGTGAEDVLSALMGTGSPAGRSV
ncbi:MAG: ribosome biogenesis GTP-binding protein YihA/YsxC [Oscillospiraceae bacterium]|jgi:GTP-binding protein|nr:ribosome biogenesis GTP-binding protein YihA/YsxC [Oscillospiraceae bacterium]